MKRLRNTIKAMFEQAKKSKLVHTNPALDLKMPKATDGSHRCITDFEREHFLKVAANHHAGLMFKVMLYCGLRTGEVVALEWRDIDVKKKRFKITRALESGSNNIKSPKTEAGIREVPILSEIFSELMAIKGDPFTPIFLQQRGKVRHTHSSRRTAWNSLKNQIDITIGAKFKVTIGETGARAKRRYSRL